MEALKKGRGILVCFSGVDGSGKSTHAKALFGYLLKRNFSCTYVWAGTILIFSYFFYMFTLFLGYWKKTENEKNVIVIDPLGLAPESLREQIFDSIWRYFLFFDFQIRTLLRIRLPLVLGKVVICDRYIYDLMADLLSSGRLTRNFYQLLLQTVPIPNLIFLTDAEKDILGHRREINDDVLDKKRKAYLTLNSSLHFFVLNTENGFDENQKKVREQTIEYLDRDRKSAVVN